MAGRSKFWDLSDKQWQNKFILLTLWFFIFIGLYLVRTVLLPFIIAILLAYVFHPLVAKLTRLKLGKWSISRPLAVITIYFASTILLVVLALVIIPQFYSEMVKFGKDASLFLNSIDDESIGRLGQNIEQFFRDYQLPLEITHQAGDEVPAGAPRNNLLSIDLVSVFHNSVNEALVYIKSQAKNIISSAQYLVSKSVAFLFMTMLIIMLTGFILVDVDAIKKYFFKLIPLRNQEGFTEFLKRLDLRLSGVVRGQLTICLVNAVLTLIGLLILKIKFAFTLAAIAGVFSLIPIFGSILSTIPIFLVALTISPFKAILSLMWIGIIHIVEANLLNPKILGDSAKIHPVIIVMSLLVGERYYGIAGALIAVPIMSVIITVFATLLSRAQSLDEVVAKPVEGDKIA